VNHTFTSNLALSASLQPYAGLKDHVICEYPTELKSLAVEMTNNRIERNSAGLIAAPDAPGHGIEVNRDTIRRYIVPVEINVRGKTLYRTPDL
jgi:L-alanine-DL-glutamate epimerase-like enolase superfamily enzyme